MENSREVNVEVTIKLKFDLSIPNHAVEEYVEKHGMPGPFGERIVEIDEEIVEDKAKEFLADRILYDGEQSAPWLTKHMELTEVKLTK